MLGVASFLVRQCQLSINNRCDAQLAFIAQIFQEPPFPELARTIHLWIPGNETRWQPETQVESIHVIGIIQ